MLPLTDAAIAHYAAILAERKVLGRAVASLDALIAGIARDAGLPLVTRNVPAFEGLGIELVNPWEAAAG